MAISIPRTIWAHIALFTIRFARIPCVYRFSTYAASKAGFFGDY